MTTRGQITKRAQEEGVTAHVVERDYVLAHAVAAIAAADREHALAFKGGTSLRLLHFDDYRYSADLDYSVTTGSAADAAALIRSAFAAAATTPVALRVLDGDPLLRSRRGRMRRVSTRTRSASTCSTAGTRRRRASRRAIRCEG